ncbi:hypothetical protein P3S67_010906 [Capsicum chacoense]
MTVSKRVTQIQNLVENTEEKFQKTILNERIVRLSSGIGIIQPSDAGSGPILPMDARRSRDNNDHTDIL